MTAHGFSRDDRPATLLPAVLLAALLAAVRLPQPTEPFEAARQHYAPFRLAAVPEVVGGGPERTCAIPGRRGRDLAVGMPPRTAVPRTDAIDPLGSERRRAPVDGSAPCGVDAPAQTGTTTPTAVGGTGGTAGVGRPGTSSSLFWTALASAILAVAAGAAAAASRRPRRRLAALADVFERVVADAFAETRASSPVADPVDRIEQGVLDLPARLSSAREQVRRTVAIVAHDLRTPLCRMRARLERALASGASDDGHVERAVEDCDGLATLLDALLAISSLERGEGRSRFQVLDLGELAEALVEAYEPAVSDGGRTIRLLRAVEPPATVMGDRALLMQAAANLLDNALLHTPPGTAVSLGVSAQGGDAVLSVSDDGPGAASANLARLAEPFFRAHRADDGSGHGLGMAMAAATARAHGGRMEVEDADPGLRVRLLLPRAA